jgi:CheY-like chemotaxis protein
MATILVIDDEPVVADLLADLLAEAGHAVVTATNGAEGLQRAQDIRPDLIISDVMMPKLDGHGLARAIAASPLLRATPLVLMSAGPARPNSLDPPVVAFLPKPFRLEQVLDLLARLLA